MRFRVIPQSLLLWPPKNILENLVIQIKSTSHVSEHSFNLLQGPQELNDEIMDALVFLCLQASTTAFEYLTTLEVQVQERFLKRKLRNWRPVLRKNGISSNIIVMLLNWENSHWGILIFDRTSSGLFFYESTLNFIPTTTHLQVFQTFLTGSQLSVPNFLEKPPQRLPGPVQSDSWSCGWWTVVFLNNYLNLSSFGEPGLSADSLRKFVYDDLFLKRILTTNTC